MVPTNDQAKNAAPIGIVETSNQKSAKHSITIISAFSCTFCRALDQQGMNELRTHWAPRGLKIETVPFILSPTDVAANIALTCGPSRGYARRMTILFRAQPEMLSNWRAAPEEERRRAEAMPNGSGAPAIAKLSGLHAIAPSLGLSGAQLDACLNDPTRQKVPGQRQQAADARWNVTGTPTVLIDGVRVTGTWVEIRRALVAKMAG